ncbi:MAG: NADH-quinone oxidoreductase subunit H [Chthonomonadales bacterium]|nr:NADH-quinone oxidoreductase subunit H [Chthonomonadales bacterium]
MNPIALGALTLVIAPILGGLLMGLDRRITARLQNRLGPPILQPFYDVGKLMGKQPVACNSFQGVAASLYLMTSVLALLMFVLGQDLLVLLFVLALGAVMLILGGFSVKSPYSQLGSQREVLQMLAYEPLLVLMVVGVYLQTGSFSANSVLALDRPLLLTMPIFLVTQTLVIGIKLHKSPFDVSASHHAHQELVRGIYTEFSGLQLALIELAHFYELVLLLGFVWFLWHTNWLVGAALALAAYFSTILMDNVTARMTWRWLVSFMWTWGIGLAVANLAAIYFMLRVPR